MDPPESPASTSPRRRLIEVGLAVVVATALAAVLYRVPLLSRYYSAIVAAILLYVPAWILRRRDLADHGLTAAPLGRGLTLAAEAALLIFPPFFGVYLLWQKTACALPLLRGVALGACDVALLSGFSLRLPPDFLELAAAQLVVVALPEEFFFRGYVQGRLAELWPRPTLFSVPVGPVVVASLLFALCHVIVQGSLAPLAVFFPGLVFGILRARTGSILAGTLFHAACNLYIETLNRSFFGG